MCGRYGFVFGEKFYSRYEVENREDLPINFNVTPGMVMPVVTKNSPKQVQMMRWGLLPSWAKDTETGYRMINAMGETVSEKPAFRKAFREQRCLVPVNFFYEWKNINGEKVPYLFRDKQETYLSLAGLYENMTYTIITTKANREVAKVHKRMPVILSRIEEEKWLDKDAGKEELLRMLDSYEEKQFESYEVSQRVNKPENNDAELIKKVINREKT